MPQDQTKRAEAAMSTHCLLAGGHRRILRPDAVESVFAAATQKRPGRAAWNLLFYTLWHRRHIDRATLPPDTAAAVADPGRSAGWQIMLIRLALRRADPTDGGSGADAECGTDAAS